MAAFIQTNDYLFKPDLEGIFCPYGTFHAANAADARVGATVCKPQR
jgi:hypothetical protein